MKTLWCVLVGIGVTLYGLDVGAQAEKEIQLDIKSQVLADALNEWAQVTGFRLIGSGAATRNLSSPRLQGAFTPRAALSRLLEGTTLTYEFLDERTVTINEQLPAPPSQTSIAGNERQSRLAADQNTARKIASARESDTGEGTRTLEEIIVTAQKREQSVQDVPISISVLNGEAIENAGLDNITQLTYAVPGLSSVEPGPGFQNISMRGVGNIRGSASLIGLYLDEAAVAGASEQQIDLRLFDVARVEVLRGPQGTLYGEGSMGGTIRYITNDPDLDSFAGNVEVSAFDTRKGGMSESVKGVVNLPVVTDRFGVRIAATYEDASGWIDQPAANREDINNSDLKNIRVKSLWSVNDEFNIKATAIIHRNKGDGYNYVNTGPNSDSNYTPGVNPETVTPYKDDYEHYGLTLDYDFGFASLVSASSYTDMDKFTLQSFLLAFPPAGSPLVGFNEFTTQGVEIFTQELRLTSNDAKRLKWTAGAFYRDSDNSNIADFNFGGFLFGGDSLESSESIAFFGDGEYALTDRLAAGAGLRYFEDHRSLTDRLAGTKLEETFSAVSPRAYMSLAATKDIHVYASVAKGFRSGTFNTAAAIAAGAPAGVDPEALWNYEVGAKTNFFNGRVSADLSLFYSEYENLITAGLVPGSQVPIGQVANAGVAEIRGIEWQLLWNASDQLRLGFNGNFVDSEITKVTLADAPVIVGDPPDNVPEYEYSIFMDSSFKWSDSVPGFIRMNYNVQGKMYYHDRSSASGFLEPFDSSDVVRFLDLRIGGQWSGWIAEMFVANLLDEDGFVTAYQSYGAAAQARPRSIGVKLGVSF